MQNTDMKKTTGKKAGSGRDEGRASPDQQPESIRLRLTPEDVQARAKVLKALGHPTRLHILDLLEQGDLCLCEFNPLFKIRQPTLSRHLAVLKQAGIITERRAGSRLILHLATPCILRSFDCAIEVVQADHVRRSHAVKKIRT